MQLRCSDILEIIDRRLMVNGRPFKVTYPDEPLFRIKDGKLMTLVFKGCGCTINTWEHEDIEGEFI